MNAKVLVEYTVKNVCDPEDFGGEQFHKTFEELVRWLIDNEGIHGVADEKYKIISVSECKQKPKRRKHNTRGK